MDKLRYTLVSDGSSDAALIPILHWLLKQNGVSCPIQSAFVALEKELIRAIQSNNWQL